jgi:hypothetical protein
MLGQLRPVPGSLFLYIPDLILGSRIPDPTAPTKEEGKNTVHPLFFVATNMTKLKIIILLNSYRKTLSQSIKNYSSKKYGFGIRESGKTIGQWLRPS